MYMQYIQPKPKILHTISTNWHSSQRKSTEKETFSQFTVDFYWWSVIKIHITFSLGYNQKYSIMIVYQFICKNMY